MREANQLQAMCEGGNDENDSIKREELIAA